MTIPITPGPFSFLQGAGEALGRFAEEKEKKRQQGLKEAKDQLSTMIDLRAKGLIDPGQFESPEAMRLYQILGLGPVSGKPTSTEMLETGKRDYLSTIIPQLSQGGAMSDEARSVIGAPERGLTQKIEAGIAQNVSAVPQAQLQGAQATAGLPEAGTTVIAGQQTTQDKTFNDIADRVVEAMYARTKKLPTSAEALKTGQTDERGKVFGSRISEPYYGQAIERLRAKLADEQTKRMQATARATGASGTGLDDLSRIYQNQQTRATAELNALPKPSDNDFRMADAAANTRARGKPVSKFFTQAEDRIAEYNRKRADLEAEIKTSRDQLNRVLGPAIGVNPPAPTQIRPLASGQFDAIVQRMKQQKIPASQIDLDVRNGLISAQDGEEIKRRLGAK